MKAVFLHQNFPAQLLAVASALRAAGGHDLLAVTPSTNTRPRVIPRKEYLWPGDRTGTSVSSKLGEK
jgi:hypothetical protein